LAQGADAHVQWYRLAAAWGLMERVERGERRGRRYAVVVKVRFDEAPMQPWHFRDIVGGARLFAVHAATDHTFWGRRDAMAVAARTWDGMETHFFSEQGRQPLTRPLCVGAMLRSWQALPPQALTQRSWKYYNKLTTLPYPEFGLNPGRTPAGVVSSLRAASEAGWDCFDPRSRSALPILPPNMSVGLSFRPLHTVTGMFVTEKDFLVWLIMNNVAVCDLGAGTTTIMYKGHYFARPSRDCSTAFEVWSQPDPGPPSRFSGCANTTAR
jgi:hypothetical protein